MSISPPPRTLLARAVIVLACTLGLASSGLLDAPPARADFGIESFSGSLAEPDGVPLTQAGAHPDLTIDLALKTIETAGVRGPDGNVRQISTVLPPGLLGNPEAFQRCSQSQLKGETSFEAECPVDSQVGVVEISNCVSTCAHPFFVPLYNMRPPEGMPGQFAFNYQSVLVFINVKVGSTAASGGGYTVETVTEDISQGLALAAIKVTLWGVPAEAVHDPLRSYGPEHPNQTGAPGSLTETPLIRNPTSCSARLAVDVLAEAWAASEPARAASFDTDEGGTTPLAATGCERVPFAPSITVTPTSPQAAAPTGLEVGLDIPQNENPHGLASADLRNLTVTLPAGMAVDPSSADGLQACGVAEIALHSEASPSCPDGSKIGELTIRTPLLEEPMRGAVYLARQGENPFDSTLALYLVASGSGVLVKLAGEIETDPVSGRITATFTNLPQLPFSAMTLRLKGGPRAPLSNAAACGSQTATAELTSWSETSVQLTSSFDLGGPCPDGRFSPAFTAGTLAAKAGATAPFTLSFSRADGEPTFGAISVRMPPGLLGYIKDVPLCPEPAAQLGDCGASSLIGHTTVAAGAGSNPFELTGDVYLTGPYDGAPYGLAIVVPAIAGPLNLGDEIVRASIAVDPSDAHLTVTSATLPSILEGIPLQLRLISLTVDRAGFTFNPTSCEPKQIVATIWSSQGAPAPVAAPYQATGCGALPFDPTFTASTRGTDSSTRGGATLLVHVGSKSGPGLPPGAKEANIEKVDVELPRAIAIRLTTLQNACPERVFAEHPAACPAGARVGSATVGTPLLNGPLTGPAYLVSHGGAAFPDMDLVLTGDGVTIDLVGNTQITKGRVYSKFEAVPDAPIESFALTLPQGPGSVLVPNGALCDHSRTVTKHELRTRRRDGRAVHVLEAVTRRIPAPLLMPTTITAQSGVVLQRETTVAVTGCPRRRPARTGR